MMDDTPDEDKKLAAERAKRPPRFLLALADFETDTQRQVGVAELDDLFNPLTPNGQQKLQSTDFWRFIQHFKLVVKNAEDDYYKRTGTRSRIVAENEMTPEQIKERDAAIAASINAPQGDTTTTILPELPTDKYNDLTPEQRIIRAQALAQEGLGTDGGHHKQWYLHEIAQVLGVEYDLDEFEEGIKP